MGPVKTSTTSTSSFITVSISSTILSSRRSNTANKTNNNKKIKKKNKTSQKCDYGSGLKRDWDENALVLATTNTPDSNSTESANSGRDRLSSMFRLEKNSHYSYSSSSSLSGNYGDKVPETMMMMMTARMPGLEGLGGVLGALNNSPNTSMLSSVSSSSIAVANKQQQLLRSMSAKPFSKNQKRHHIHRNDTTEENVSSSILMNLDGKNDSKEKPRGRPVNKYQMADTPEHDTDSGVVESLGRLSISKLPNNKSKNLETKQVTHSESVLMAFTSSSDKENPTQAVVTNRSSKEESSTSSTTASRKKKQPLAQSAANRFRRGTQRIRKSAVQARSTLLSSSCIHSSSNLLSSASKQHHTNSNEMTAKKSNVSSYWAVQDIDTNATYTTSRFRRPDGLRFSPKSKPTRKRQATKTGELPPCDDHVDGRDDKEEQTQIQQHKIQEQIESARPSAAAVDSQSSETGYILGSMSPPDTSNDNLATLLLFHSPPCKRIDDKPTPCRMNFNGIMVDDLPSVEEHHFEESNHQDDTGWFDLDGYEDEEAEEDYHLCCNGSQTDQISPMKTTSSQKYNSVSRRDVEEEEEERCPVEKEKNVLNTVTACHSGYQHPQMLEDCDKCDDLLTKNEMNVSNTLPAYHIKQQQPSRDFGKEDLNHGPFDDMKQQKHNFSVDKPSPKEQRKEMSNASSGQCTGPNKFASTYPHVPINGVSADPKESSVHVTAVLSSLPRDGAKENAPLVAANTRKSHVSPPRGLGFLIRKDPEEHAHVSIKRDPSPLDSKTRPALLTRTRDQRLFISKSSQRSNATEKGQEAVVCHVASRPDPPSPLALLHHLQSVSIPQQQHSNAARPDPPAAFMLEERLQADCGLRSKARDPTPCKTVTKTVPLFRVKQKDSADCPSDEESVTLINDCAPMNVPNFMQHSIFGHGKDSSCVGSSLAEPQDAATNNVDCEREGTDPLSHADHGQDTSCLESPLAGSHVAKNDIEIDRDKEEPLFRAGNKMFSTKELVHVDLPDGAAKDDPMMPGDSAVVDDRGSTFQTGAEDGRPIDRSQEEVAYFDVEGPAEYPIDEEVAIQSGALCTMPRQQCQSCQRSTPPSDSVSISSNPNLEEYRHISGQNSTAVSELVTDKTPAMEEELYDEEKAMEEELYDEEKADMTEVGDSAEPGEILLNVKRTRKQPIRYGSFATEREVDRKIHKPKRNQVKKNNPAGKANNSNATTKQSKRGRPKAVRDHDPIQNNIEPKSSKEGSPVPKQLFVFNGDARQPLVESLDEWQEHEVEMLRRAHTRVDPAASFYWEQVASMMEGRTAKECSNKWWSLASTPPKQAQGRRKKTEQQHYPRVALQDEDVFGSSRPLPGFQHQPREQQGSYGDDDKGDEDPMGLGSPIKYQLPHQALNESHAPAVKGRYGNKKYVKDLKRAVLNKAKSSKPASEPFAGAAPTKRGRSGKATVSDTVQEGDYRINASMTPGGTLRVRHHHGDEDDFWQEAYGGTMSESDESLYSL